MLRTSPLFIKTSSENLLWQYRSLKQISPERSNQNCPLQNVSQGLQHNSPSLLCSAAIIGLVNNDSGLAVVFQVHVCLYTNRGHCRGECSVVLAGITCLNAFYLFFLLKFSWNLWVTEGCRILKLVREWRKIMSVPQTAFCMQRFHILCITKCSTHIYWGPPIWKKLSQLMSQESANTEQCTSKRCFEKYEEEMGGSNFGLLFEDCLMNVRLSKT